VILLDPFLLSTVLVDQCVQRHPSPIDALPPNLIGQPASNSERINNRGLCLKGSAFVHSVTDDFNLDGLASLVDRPDTPQLEILLTLSGELLRKVCMAIGSITLPFSDVEQLLFTQGISQAIDVVIQVLGHPASKGALLY
jgi:hypothetical protein